MTSSAPKITFIGAGSTVFTRNLLGDILAYPELAQAHIALHDIDPHRLELSRLVAQRVADALGVTHDSLYKWLATGRLPAILIPTYEHACGCHFVSEWLAASAGRLVIDMPKGRTVSQSELVELNSGFAAALQLLTNFYASDGKADPIETLDALTTHLQQVAWHHANVNVHATPELEFGA